MTTPPVISVTDELIAELKSVTRNATPGPWVADMFGISGQGGYPKIRASGHIGPIAEVRSNLKYSGLCEAEHIERAGNAEFISAANPAMLLALLAERAELKRDAERYRWLRAQDWYDSPLCVLSNPKHSVKLGSDYPSRERLDQKIDQWLYPLQE